MDRKSCELFNVEINRRNWAKHLRTRKHLRNDPSKSFQPRKRGRQKSVQLHHAVKFHKSVFGQPNVRKIVRRKECAFRSRLLTLEI